MNAAVVPLMSNPSCAAKYYPCTGVRLYARPVVLLHGWGMDSQIWQSLPQRLSQSADIMTLDLPGFGSSPPLSDYSENALHQWLAEQLPARCYLIGLSLGGMLASGFAARYPQRVEGLITLSSNLCFAANDAYVSAMHPQQFAKFIEAWCDDHNSCLKRFVGLQAQGDSQQRQLMRALRSLQVEIDRDSGEHLLRLLGEMDNSIALSQLQCPTLALFGRHDALVPAASAANIAALNSLIDCHIIEGAGHLPQLSQPEKVSELISEFLARHHYALDKAKIADSFGRAAALYDRAAQLQHQVGEQAIAKLFTTPTPISATTLTSPAQLTKVIDLGCGTGYHCSQLQARFPNATITGIDLSPAMLAYAAEHNPQGQWLCGDAEDLPLQNQSQELIFSNFALQWCENLPRLSAELYRVLKPGGRISIVIPGQQTLTELRSAWQQVDDRVHVNRFYALSDWQAALQQAGFCDLELVSEQRVQQHRSVRELLMELKQVGAHNNNAGKQSTLTGKQQLKALYAAYEQFRVAPHSLPASWEIISIRAIK